jgi:hypothetical protein
VAGIFQAIAFAYLFGGFYCAFEFTVMWLEKGYALRRDWVELAAIAFLLWPLIQAQEILSTIRNRKRDRIARSRGRV